MIVTYGCYIPGTPDVTEDKIEKMVPQCTGPRTSTRARSKDAFRISMIGIEGLKSMHKRGRSTSNSRRTPRDDGGTGVVQHTPMINSCPARCCFWCYSHPCPSPRGRKGRWRKEKGRKKMYPFVFACLDCWVIAHHGYRAIMIMMMISIGVVLAINSTT